MSAQMSGPFHAADRVTTACLHRRHGVGELRRGARGTGGLWTLRTTATGSPSSSCTACSRALSPSSPRPRLPSRPGRSGRPRGPRRRRRGSPRVVGSPRAAAKRRVRLGRTLRHLPGVCAGLARRGHRGRPGPGHRLGPAPPHRGRHGPGRGDAGLPGQRPGLRGLLPGLVVLEAAGRPRRGRGLRRGAQGGARRVLGVELQRHVAGPDDAGPHLGLHRGGRAQPPRARPLRGRLRRGQGAPGPHRPASTSWPAPRASAGPTPWWRWRRAAAAPRPRASAPPRCSASSSATRHSTAASASSRTARCCAPAALGPVDGLGLLRAGHLLAWAPGSTSACGPGSSAAGPDGPSNCATASAPTRTATSPPRTARSTTSRPTPRGPHHPGERPPALRLPQPPAQPTRTPRRPAPAPAPDGGVRGGRRRVAHHAPARPGHHPPARSGPAQLEKAARLRHFGVLRASGGARRTSAPAASGHRDDSRYPRSIAGRSARSA